MTCTGTGGKPLTSLDILQIRAMDTKLSDDAFEKLFMDFTVESREDLLELQRIAAKYRPKLARKIERKIFEGGSKEAFAQLREYLVGKTIKDVRRVDPGYGIELVLKNGDVATLQVEGGKDSVEPQGFLHWFVARVNFKEWFRI